MTCDPLSSPDVDRCQYGYDQDFERVWKSNLLTTGLDELYVYDPLNRLVNMQRGSLNTAKTAIGGGLIVTALGRWVVAGSSGTHNVKLVDAATGTDLAGALVSINTNGATAGQYLYAPLANPIPLTPGHGYYLMTQETSGGDQWYDQNTSITVTSDLTANSAEYYDTSYHTGNPGAYSYGPPNLAYGPATQPAITSQTLGTLRNNFTGWVGFKFTTASGIPAREMDWTLDPTGNWTTFLTKTSGTVDLNQTRTASKVNEIAAIGGTPTWATPAYDAAGNMITMPQPAAPTSSYAGVYDAWNRLVQISAAGTVVAKYQYDGRNRRTVKLTYSGGVLSETRHFYFTNNWRDIEERTGSPATMERQYVWGLRYTDELVCRDRTGERYYCMQDASFNLTSICDTGGAEKERYRFDPYGSVTIMNATWSVIGSSAYSWAVGHQGLLHDVETGLIYNRFRLIHGLLGGFTRRDPLQYVLGPNLYEYLRGAPPNYVDSLGLAVNCGEAEKCFIDCLSFYIRCISCKHADPDCNTNLPRCLNGCKQIGRAINSVALRDCPPPVITPSPPPPCPKPEAESPARTMAPHTVISAAEQAARLAATTAGEEGGSEIIGPAATVAGGLEAAPEAVRLGIITKARIYFSQHNDIKDFACDPGYINNLITTTETPYLNDLLYNMERGKTPLPNTRW